ncbi:MAG: hypothetical protein ACI3XR_03935 [Eubacteriales bacterium]
MKKRLMSLGLSVLMLASAASVLTSCGGDETVSTDEVVKPMTVTLNMITDERTTEEGIAAVQEAINQITENDLNIHVVLQLYTEDEYHDVVLNKSLARDSDILAGKQYSSIGSEDDEVVIEIVEGKYRTVTAYPEPYENQIDIFMITSYDMLTEFADAGIVADVSDSLNSTDASLLNKYVSSNLMTYGQIMGSQYAIPGNSYYGGYEYLLVKKSLFDKYPYSISDVTGLSSLRDYLVDVAENEEGVIPLYNVGSLGLTSALERDSVVSSYVPDGAVETDTYRPDNIMKNASVQAQLATIIACGSVNGDYAKDVDVVDFDANFAAAFVTGDADTPEIYGEDYYVVQTRKPVADASEIFSSMFAVSEYSSDVARCMQVVNLLMTNEELLNTVLYGVENVTYIRDEDTGIVSRKYTSDTNSIYIMDENLIGNIFLAWQNDEMSDEVLSVSADNWKLAKQASTDATFSPFAHFPLVWDEALNETAKGLNELYVELWTKVEEYNGRVDPTTGEQYTPDTYVSGYLNSWISGMADVLNAVDTTKETTLAGQYLKWYHDNFADG